MSELDPDLRALQDVRDCVARSRAACEAVHGYTQMNKDHLLPAICKALGVEAHAHHQTLGLDKAALKARMRQLREERARALQARDHAQLKSIRRQLHRLNRRIRAATV